MDAGQHTPNNRRHEIGSHIGPVDLLSAIEKDIRAASSQGFAPSPIRMTGWAESIALVRRVFETGERIVTDSDER